MRISKANKIKRKWGVIIILSILLAAIPFSQKEVHAWTDENIGFITELDENATDGNGNPLINICNYRGSEENLVIPEKIDGHQVFQIYNWDIYGTDHRSTKSIEIQGNYIFLGNINSDDYNSENVFYACKNLENIIISKNNYKYTSVDGVVYSKDMTEIVACPAGKTSITIPDTVTRIGNSAFRGCEKLKEINIPAGVTEIGSYAFAGCTNLNKIVIPEGVLYMEFGALFNCTSLTEIVIPSSLTYITAALSCLDSLKSIKVDEDNARYASKDGVLYSKDMTILFLCPTQIEKNELIIPDGVSKICDGAFSGCTNLTSIQLPNSLEHIGICAFSRCTGLQKVIMPDELTYMGGNIFDGCSSLKSIVIPKGVKSLYSAEFRYCTSLTSVYIPDGVKEIGSNIFTECINLEKITIPESVENIRNDAFDGCDKLIIYCYSGSYAQSYAKENNIPYRLIDIMGWKYDSTGWWYDNGDGTYPKSTWQNIDGSWYYFNNSGYMTTGWLQDGNKWYYLESNGKMATGWKQISGSWYYFESSGVMAANKWVNSVYYMKSNGAMAVNEWVDGGRYYVDSNGKWVPNKTKATWKKDAKGWWYDNGDGTYPKSTWKSIDGSWYYFNNSGYMVTGWLNDGGKWYYLETSGKMATSKWINGTYYVKANGVMAVSEWVDVGRYYVDANGKWVVNKTA